LIIPDLLPKPAKLFLVLNFLVKKQRLGKDAKRVLKAPLIQNFNEFSKYINLHLPRRAQELIINGDAMLLSALLAWELDQNGEELEDTMRLLCEMRDNDREQSHEKRKSQN